MVEILGGEGLKILTANPSLHIANIAKKRGGAQRSLKGRLRTANCNHLILACQASGNLRRLWPFLFDDEL